MPDAFDRLIADVRRLEARARVGALDEKNAEKLRRNEFGTPNGVPPRPTLTAAFDRSERALQRAVDRRVAAVLDGKSEAGGRRILSEVGEDLAELVRDEIGSDVQPPLAESTKQSRRRRGKDERTLVDSDEMRKSIRVESKADTGEWDDAE